MPVKTTSLLLPMTATGNLKILYLSVIKNY